MTRLRFVQRLTSAIVGAIVTAVGAVAIASLSGVEIDFELIWIIGLGAVGIWLLLTAAIAAVKPSRRDQARTNDAEADVDVTPAAADAAADAEADVPANVKRARAKAQNAVKES